MTAVHIFDVHSGKETCAPLKHSCDVERVALDQVPNNVLFLSAGNSAADANSN